MLFLIKRACTVAPQLRRPGLAQSRRLYWPASQGSALIRQASLGPSWARDGPPITCGAGFSLWRCLQAGSSGPCVPRALALGPLAVHRWLYHPKSARCFTPFTTTAARPVGRGRVHLRCLVGAGRWRAACQLRQQVMGRLNSYLASIPRRPGTPVSSLYCPTPCTSPSPAGPVRKDPARCVRRSQCGPDRWVVCICAA